MVHVKYCSPFPWFGGNQKTTHTVKYPDLPSTIRSVLHSKDLPVAEPLEYLTFGNDNSASDEDQRQQEQAMLIAI